MEMFGLGHSDDAFDEKPLLRRTFSHRTESELGDLGRTRSPAVRKANCEAKFPMRLHVMLQEVHNDINLKEMASWNPEGDAFKVHQKTLFAERILPRYFLQSKYRSFQRQLNHYGFERITQGPFEGGYKHPNFVKDDRQKCHVMKRLLRESISKHSKAGRFLPRSSSIEQNRRPVTAVSPDISDRPYLCIESNCDHHQLQYLPRSPCSTAQYDPTPFPYSYLPPPNHISYPPVARGYLPFHSSTVLARGQARGFVSPPLRLAPSPGGTSSGVTKAPLQSRAAPGAYFSVIPSWFAAHSPPGALISADGEITAMSAPTICSSVPPHASYYDCAYPHVDGHKNWEPEVLLSTKRGMTLCGDIVLTPPSQPPPGPSAVLTAMNDRKRIINIPATTRTSGITLDGGFGGNTLTATTQLACPSMVTKCDPSKSERSVASSTCEDDSLLLDDDFMDGSAMAAASWDDDSASLAASSWMSSRSGCTTDVARKQIQHLKNRTVSFEAEGEPD